LLVSILISQEKGVITIADLMLLVYNGMFLLPASFALLTIAPTLISAPEVSLFSLIETVLGPVLVWFGGFEAPPVSAIYGGVLLIFALIVHSYIALIEERKKAQLLSVIDDNIDAEMVTVTSSPLWIDAINTKTTQ
jgi:hypothetical protein